MFASTPTGFKDAPLSKLLCLGTLVMPIATSLLNIQYLFPLAVSPHLLPWHQWYRILLNSAVYTDQVQAFVAAELFYESRVVERFLGTRKFANLVAGVWTTTTVALPLVMTLITPIVNLQSSSGSKALLAGLVAAYWDLVPPVFYYKLEGVATFTDKIFLLLLAPNLFYDGASIVKVVLGWISGLIVLRYL